MSRPDQDPILIGMGVGESTCDKCLTSLYPNEPDSVCNDCALNPLRRGTTSMHEFIEQSVQRTATMDLPELVARVKISP